MKRLLCCALLVFSAWGSYSSLISPKLRDQVQGAIGVGVTAMDTYAPYSYAAGVIVVLVTLVVSFNRGSQAR